MSDFLSGSFMAFSCNILFPTDQYHERINGLEPDSKDSEGVVSMTCRLMD